ncbi:MAG: P1 family peptidase [Deltaproteobacteria bacterium]|nr:P1 family peptidase [Deltaproteobacteria bacterium]
MFNVFAALLLGFASAFAAQADRSERARDLGIHFEGETGTFNAITDVPGVAVNLVTIVANPDGDPHAARTGITAIFPKVQAPDSHVPGALYSLNGNGEMTGALWLQESGDLEGPILLTNTYSVGLVRDTVREWAAKRYPTHPDQYDDTLSLPIVGETFDGFLSDINGMHVKKDHVYQALKNPSTGPVAEGNVGGGTGMSCFGFKCGTGTSSRRVKAGGKDYVVGVLVQANYGAREDLMVQGVSLARQFTDLRPVHGEKKKKDGSIIVVVATNAPLLPGQLKRLAQRVPLGLGRAGSIGDNSSGDIFIAFSTVSPQGAAPHLQVWHVLPNEMLADVFRAVSRATEEAVINALVAAETMTGVLGNKMYAIPHQRLLDALKKKP